MSQEAWDGDQESVSWTGSLAILLMLNRASRANFQCWAFKTGLVLGQNSISLALIVFYKIAFLMVCICVYVCLYACAHACVCMCVHTRVYVWVLMCMHVCVSVCLWHAYLGTCMPVIAQNPEESSILLHYSPPYSFERGSLSLNPELSQCLECLGVPLFLFTPMLGSQAHRHTQIFMWGLDIWTQVLMLSHKLSDLLSHLSSPAVYLTRSVIATF